MRCRVLQLVIETRVDPHSWHGKRVEQGQRLTIRWKIIIVFAARGELCCIQGADGRVGDTPQST